MPWKLPSIIDNSKPAPSAQNLKISYPIPPHVEPRLTNLPPRTPPLQPVPLSFLPPGPDRSRSFGIHNLSPELHLAPVHGETSKANYRSSRQAYNHYRESLQKGPFKREGTNSFVDTGKAEPCYSSSDYSVSPPSTRVRPQSDIGNSNDRESVTRSKVLVYLAMTGLGVLLLLAISLGAIGTADFIETRKSSGTEVEVTRSEVYIPPVSPVSSFTSSLTSSLTLSLTPSLTSSLTLSPTSVATENNDDGAPTGFLTLTLGLSTIQPPTSTSGSMGSKSTSATKTASPSQAREDGTIQVRVLDVREEAIVIGQEPECDLIDTSTASPTPSITASLQPSNHSSQTSSISSAVQSNVARRRFQAPFAWAKIGRAPAFDQPNLSLTSWSPLPTQIKQETTDGFEQLVSIASTNAATPQFSKSWASQPTTLSTAALSVARRQHSARKFTFWEVYVNIQNLAIQLCSATQRYQETPGMKSAEDDSMATWVNSYICDVRGTTFPNVAQGAKCDTKSEWETLKAAVESLCSQQRTGKIVVQSVNLLCSVKSTLEGNMEQCNGGNNSSSSVVGGSTTSLSVISKGTFPSSVLMLASMTRTWSAAGTCLQSVKSLRFLHHLYTIHY